MLTKVDITSELGQTMTLNLTDVVDGFAIEDITGLGPVKAALSGSSFAGFDGGDYQSSRRDNRNIVLKIGLEPNFVTNTVRSLRDQLYSFFMTESRVLMRFYFDDDMYDIVGYVETCEPNHFSDEPQVVISILCFKPDFLDSDTSSVSGNTVSTATEFVVTYPGTSPTGFVFTLNVNRTLTQFTIYNRTGDAITRSMDFAANLVAGDVLTISTVPGDKYAKLLRASVESSVIYGVSPQATWLQLLKGANNMRVYATGAAIPFTMTYVSRYGGL